jgi:hypothetical protein
MYVLDPTMPVLLRPDSTVQIGWDPRRAVRVRPPDGMDAGTLAAVLRAMHSPMSRAESCRAAAGFDDLLEGLLAAGVVRELPSTPAGRCLSIRVHGAGPLSDLLAEGLRCSGARVSRASHGTAAVAPAGVDLVVLADNLAADPRLVRDLQARGVPHLPVLMRDGAGVVGPLVLPGRSACLCCVDLHRTDRDPAWPALAVQLRDLVGSGDRATVLATVALALGQLQQIITAVQNRPAPAPVPATVGATVEVDVGTQSIVARRWPRHPLCGCWPEPPSTGGDH